MYLIFIKNPISYYYPKDRWHIFAKHCYESRAKAIMDALWLQQWSKDNIGAPFQVQIRMIENV